MTLQTLRRISFAGVIGVAITAVLRERRKEENSHNNYFNNNNCCRSLRHVIINNNNNSGHINRNYNSNKDKKVYNFLEAGENFVKFFTTCGFTSLLNIRELMQINNNQRREFLGLANAEQSQEFILPIPQLMSFSRPETLHEIPMPNRPPVQLILRPHKSETIENFIASSQLEENWDKSFVKQLNGDKFKELATNPTKNLLVFFYIPNCSQCNKLDKVLNELAKRFVSRDDIMVAKIDLSVNIIDNPSSVRLPMLKLYPVDNKGGGYKYAGEKSIEALYKFVDTSGHITTLTEKMIVKLQKKIEEKELSKKKQVQQQQEYNSDDYDGRSKSLRGGSDGANSSNSTSGSSRRLKNGGKLLLQSLSNEMDTDSDNEKDSELNEDSGEIGDVNDDDDNGDRKSKVKEADEIDGEIEE